MFQYSKQTGDKILFSTLRRETGTAAGSAALRVLLIVAAAGVLAVVFGTVAAARFAYCLLQDLPTVAQMQNIEQSLSSKVLDSDGKVVHRFSVEHRIHVPLAKMPADLQNAVISIEDRRFYRHWGIDLRRIARAALVDICSGGYAQGASTATSTLPSGRPWCGRSGRP
jgi:penicillin-binding protein 1A